MVPMDAIRRLNPPLRTGERVTLRVVDPVRDLIGFVTCLAPLTIEDRHGRLHQIADGTVQAARRVAPALGRDPASAPRELLDELADRAGIAGEPALHGLEAPAQVFTERGTWVEGDRRARVEGEWLTTNVTDPDLLAALCWWATRQNARSVQVRG